MLLNRVLAAALIWLSFSAAAAENPQEVFVSLRSSAVVDERRVHLGDVAEVTARDPIDQARYQTLEVMRPTSMVQPLRLTRADIARQLANAFPGIAERIVWGGSSTIVVTGKLQRLSLESGINSAAAFLMEKLGGNDLVALRLLEGPNAIDVPLGNARWLPDMQAARKGGAYAEIPLIVEVDGVQVACPVLRFSISRSPRQGNASPEPVFQEAATAEPRRDAISDTRDTSPYLITRQQPVMILVDSDGIRIESEGVALDNARQGEPLRVRRTSSNIELAGRAVRRGVVMLEEN